MSDADVMLAKDVLACSLPQWYDSFAKVTIPTEILPLPADVLDYLRCDGTLLLPRECDLDLKNKTDNASDNSENSETDWSHADNEEHERPSFPEFSAAVRRTIQSLGGVAFCKLDWSSPRDATWIAFGNNLRVTDPGQLYLLLKSSDFVRHDLIRPFHGCEDAAEAEVNSPKTSYSVILRKWVDINPGHEFRCFVKGRRLLAISQRDVTQFYRHVGEDKESILTDITSFFGEHIQGRFPLENFVFDVVRQAKDRVSLVDFGPFGPITDPGLFVWDDLIQMGKEDGIDFQFIETNAGIQPNGMRQYSLPLDIVDLSTGSDPYKLIDFLKLQQQQQEKETQ